MLQLKELRKQYRTANLVQNALDGVSLNLRDKEFVAILGPSGSGKTTLLNIIGGLDRYDSGDLIINGTSTNQYKDRDWDTYRNHSIGFVFQSYNLIPHQTILSNVELALTISGISGSERKARAKEALTKVGLGEQINKKPSQLSGGQMQRVAIARALVNNPDILLADEPTGALDSETSVQVMDLLKEVANDRLVVMVTHNPELAYEYATRIVKIKDGKVVDDSDPFVIDEANAAGAAALGAMAAGAALGAGEAAAGNTSGADDIEMTDGPGMEKASKRKGRKKHSSMSFMTALSLSLNNLLTKKARTILVAIAGSIGIIGIALIQSLSNGVNDYIDEIEENTVLSYPVSMFKTGADMTTYMGIIADMANMEANDDEIIRINQLLHKYASGLTANDLKSLNEHILNETDIWDYASAIEYSYDIVPYIYRENNNDIRRINPDQGFGNMGGMGFGAFSQLPENDVLYKDKYEIKAGHWPENKNEAVLFVALDGSITDIVAYGIGLKDADDMDQLMKDIYEGEQVVEEEDPGEFTYDDVLGLKFKVINNCDKYVYDKENDFFVDKSDSESFMRKLYNNAEDLEIVGIAQVKEDEDGSMMSGVYYTADLVKGVVEHAAESEVVKAQLKNKDINVLTGKEFGAKQDMDELELKDLFGIDEEALTKAFDFSDRELDFSNINFDMGGMDFSGGMDFDLSSLGAGFDMGSLGLNLNISEETLTKVLSGIKFTGNNEDTMKFMNDIIRGYFTDEMMNNMATNNIVVKAGEYFASEEARQIVENFIQSIVQDAITGALGNLNVDPAVVLEIIQSGNLDALAGLIDVGAVLDSITVSSEQIQALLSQLQAGFAAYLEGKELVDVNQIMTGFGTYLSSPDVQSKLIKFAMENFDISGATDEVAAIAEALGSQVMGQVGSMLGSVMGAIAPAIIDQITSALTSVMDQIGTAIQDMFAFDENSLADAFKFEMSEDSIKGLFASMSTDSQTTFDTNIRRMGYTDLEDPDSIQIYAKDFDSKAEIIKILDTYNRAMKDADKEEKVVSYSDIAGTMMSSVSEIIGVISGVLIALVAISLVVSSIMIGVITYISVLERRKEIGVLRALGASKGNVSNVFNAETCITGFFAGVLGIVLSNLLLIIANYVIHDVINHPEITAYLDIRSAILLVVLSIFLNVLAGFLPSRKAAKSDPVIALREV